MLMASGIKFGRRPSIPHFLGIWLGFTFLFFVGGYILSFVPSEVFTYLQYIGYGVIVYIAYKIATTKTSTDKSKIEKPFTFIQACLFQWVNPKAWIMAMSAISVYAPNHELSTIFVITAAFVLINIPCQCLWTYAGEQLSHLLNNSVRLRIFNYIMALLLMLTLIEILIITI